MTHKKQSLKEVREILERALSAPDLAHAYLASGNITVLMEELPKVIEKVFNVKRSANPDFQVISKDFLSIEDARDIIEMSYMKSFGGGGFRFFIIGAEIVSDEAQNAFLKVVEEPPQETRFFFVTSAKSSLLPTLRSRLIDLPQTKAVPEGFCEQGADFMSSTVDKRRKQVASLIKNQDKQKAINLLSSIEFFLDTLDEDTWSDERKRALETVFMVKKNIISQRSSIKFLVDHLCCCTPRISK